MNLQYRLVPSCIGKTAGNKPCQYKGYSRLGGYCKHHSNKWIRERIIELECQAAQLQQQLDTKNTTYRTQLSSSAASFRNISKLVASMDNVETLNTVDIQAICINIKKELTRAYSNICYYTGVLSRSNPAATDSSTLAQQSAMQPAIQHTMQGTFEPDNAGSARTTKAEIIEVDTPETPSSCNTSIYNVITGDTVPPMHLANTTAVIAIDTTMVSAANIVAANIVAANIAAAGTVDATEVRDIEVKVSNVEMNTSASATVGDQDEVTEITVGAPEDSVVVVSSKRSRSHFETATQDRPDPLLLVTNSTTKADPGPNSATASGYETETDSESDSNSDSDSDSESNSDPEQQRFNSLGAKLAKSVAEIPKNAPREAATQSPRGKAVRVVRRSARRATGRVTQRSAGRSTKRPVKRPRY